MKISKFNIVASKFNSTMDSLARSYSIPKKVTEFERKVGKSVCRAAELAMSVVCTASAFINCTSVCDIYSK